MTAKLKTHSTSSKCANDEKTKDRKRVPCAQDYYPSSFSRSNRDFSPIRIRKKLLLLNKTKKDECARRSEELPPVYSSTDSTYSSSSDSSSISSRSGANRHYFQPAPRPTSATSSSSTFDGVGNLYKTRPASLISGSKSTTSEVTKRAANKAIDTLTTIELSSSFESNFSASTSSKSSASMEDSFSIMQKLKFNFFQNQLENKEKKKLPIGNVEAKVDHYSMYRYTNTEGSHSTLDKKTRHARSIPRASTVNSTRNEKCVSIKEAISQPNYSRNPTMSALRASIKKIDREHRISVSQEKSESDAPYNDIMLGYNKTQRK